MPDPCALPPLPAFAPAPPAPAFAFGETALLWGALAAAGPVIVHLLMRTRTRTVVFPAVRFVMAGRAADVSRLRLKHLLLLLLRAAAVAALAAALARPGCRSIGADEPIAAVFVFDNSPSMDYRVDGRTRLEQARRQALQIAAGLGPSSEAAVLDLGQGTAPPVWRPTPLGETDFAPVRPGRHTAPLGPLIARAVAAAGEHRFTRRVVYVFTDRTAHAWREPVVLGADRGDVSILLADCAAPVPPDGGFADRNYTVLPPLVERDPVGPGEPVAVQVSIRAAAARRPVRVGLHIDGREDAPASTELVFRPHLEPEPAAVDGSQAGPTEVRTVRLTRAVSAPGVYTGRVVLEGDDRLAADDVAYFHFTVAAPFKVVLVFAAGEESAEGRPAVHLAEMIEPRERRLRGVHRAQITSLPADREWTRELSDAALLVMLNVGDLSAAARDAVDRFVRAGGRLWWLCGDRTNAAAVNERMPLGLMPARMVRLCEAPSGPPLTPAHPSAPTLRVFASRGAGELERTQVRRLWEVEPRDRDTEVWATVDCEGRNLPAVLHRKVDRGSVLLWAFSPARAWTNMQDFVPEWPVLVQETVTELMGRAQARGNRFRLGEPVRRQVSDKLVGREVEWGPVSGGSTLSRRCRVEPGGVVDFGVPEEPGNYRVRLPTFSETFEEAVFSVNLDPAETLMQPQSFEWIRDRFPESARGRVRMHDPALAAEAAAGEEPLAGHLALLLLVLLTLEAFLANRFYRREPDEHAGAAPPAR